MTAPSLLDEIEGVVPGELDATAPAVIWLQLDTDGDNERRDESWAGRDGVTWCDESIGGLEIQYVRADLYRDMAKRLEAAERDSKRLDWLESQREAYGFENCHEGNRWVIDGPFATVRRAIDATQEGEE